MSLPTNNSLFSTACLVESIRLTIVGVKAGEPALSFKRLTSIEPAEQVIKPGEGSIQEVGPWNGFHLQISSNPQRIDLLLGDDPTANVNNPTAPNYKPFYNIGPLAAIERLGRDFGRKLLSDATSALRIGFAPILIIPAKSQTEANLIFKNALRFARIDIDTDSGLLWQETKQKRSRVLSLNIVRVANWQTLALTDFMVNAVTIGGNVPFASNKWAVRVLFDYNFGPSDSDFLTTENLTEMFDETIDIFNSDLAAYGDE